MRAEPAARSPFAFEPVLLTKDQARRVDTETGALEMIAKSESPVFYEALPHPYVQAVLEAGPVAYWRFDEANDKTVNNEVRPGKNDLRMMGSAYLDEQSRFGRSGRLNGKELSFDSFEMTGLLNEVGVSDAFTISCWYKLDQVQNATLFALYDFDGEDEAFRHIALIEFQDRKQVDRRLIDGRPLDGWSPQAVRGLFCDPPHARGIGSNLFSGVRYETDEWQHVVLVKDRDRMHIYLDGKPVASAQVGVGVSSGGRLSLGLTPKKSSEDPSTRLWNERPMTGWIDEVAVYDRALDKEEIATKWSAGQTTSINTTLVP